MEVPECESSCSSKGGSEFQKIAADLLRADVRRLEAGELARASAYAMVRATPWLRRRAITGNHIPYILSCRRWHLSGVYCSAIKLPSSRLIPPALWARGGLEVVSIRIFFFRIEYRIQFMLTVSSGLLIHVVASTRHAMDTFQTRWLADKVRWRIRTRRVVQSLVMQIHGMQLNPWRPPKDQDSSCTGQSQTKVPAGCHSQAD